MAESIRLGISACLLGRNVRWNGGHKLDRYLRDTLGAFVQYVPVCPEVEIGLPIPRETLRLVGSVESPRLVTTKTGIDHTERMVNWARDRVKALETENLCGFIFKTSSPSSGMTGVRVYDDKGMPSRRGQGIFARIFMEHFPRTPTTDEKRISDARMRENFIEQIFAMKRWRETLAKPRRLGELVEFHTREKLLLLSHSPSHHRQMGKLVAAGKQLPVDELYEQYEALFTGALQLKPTLRKNINVLQHIMGYFKKELTPDEKQELIEIMDEYRNGYIPLIVPVTLLNHFVRKYEPPYLRQQSYLEPHPAELQLRNHA